MPSQFFRRTALLLPVLLSMAAACSDLASPDLDSLERVGPPSMTVVTTPAVAAGGYQTCALRSTGVIECWGNNILDNAPASKSAATGSFTQIAPGYANTCALRDDGVIECFGHNPVGQAPAIKTATTGVFTAVSGGYVDYSCGVRDDGAVECWGPSTQQLSPAVRVAQSGEFTQASTSHTFMCALRTDGALECWRFDSVVIHEVFTASAGTFTQVSTGLAHRCAVTSLGRIECTGDNSYGKAPATWTAATGTFTQVSAGVQHTCALRSDGVIECKGNNENGAAPATRAAGSGSYTQVGSQNLYNTCAMTTLGLVECWGLNLEGQSMSEQRITFTSTVPPVTVGSNYNVTATSTAGLTVIFGSLTSSVCTVSGNTVTIVTEGICSIYTHQPGSASVLPAPQVTQTAQIIAGPAVVASSSSSPASITVTWTDASSIETHFRIQRRIRNGDGSWSSWLNIATATANSVSYNDAAVTAGLAYGYRIQACMGTLCSAWVTSATFLLANVPAAPASLTAAALSATRIDIAWPDANADETRFEIMRRTETAGVWSRYSLIAMPAANSTSYSDQNAVTNSRHQYQVRACNAAGCSAWTSSGRPFAQVVPAVPADFLAQVIGAAQIDLAWSDSSNEDRFEIQRRPFPVGAWSTLAQLTGNPVGYSDLTVSSGNAYRYRIRACNIAGCSAYSYTANVTTP